MNENMTDSRTLFFSPEEEKDFQTVLKDVQEYISSKYSTLILDGDSAKHIINDMTMQVIPNTIRFLNIFILYLPIFIFSQKRQGKKLPALSYYCYGMSVRYASIIPAVKNGIRGYDCSTFSLLSDKIFLPK